MKKRMLLILCGFSLMTLPVLGQIKLLHEFAGGIADGKNPYGDLIISGTIFFGMTSKGGSNDNGTIFKMQADGTGYTLLHSFAGGAADGRGPFGSLILSGSILYGMTSLGGDSNGGVIFSMPLHVHIITILAERHFVKTFGIVRQYGHLQFTVENINIPPTYYCVKRRKGSGDFITLRTITPSELQNNQFQMQDKYLEKNTLYTYKVDAFNAAGQLVGRSAEKTI